MPDSPGTRWRKRRWIIDGHNAIFALPVLGTLQRHARRQEARDELEQRLLPFSSQLSKPLLIVYDGNEFTANPDARTHGNLQTFYSQPPEEADDRIVYLTQQTVGAGESVAIVSDDRRTLGSRLPEGVQLWAVRDFWDRFLNMGEAAKEDHLDGSELSAADKDEIEAMFLERSSQIEARARQGARRREREAVSRWETRTAAARVSEERPEKDRRADPVTDEMDIGWNPKRVFESPNKPGTPTPEAGSTEQERMKEARKQADLEKQQEAAREARRTRGARKQMRRLEQKTAAKGRRTRSKKRRR